MDELTVDEARLAVADTGRRMIRDGLVDGTAGNVSIRCGDTIAMSPSSVPYDRIEADDVCLVGIDGSVIDTGPRERTPTSEWQMHLAIYRETSAKSVVHHHALSCVAVSTVVDELPPLHYYVVRLGGAVRVAPYARYGTSTLARNVLTALEGRTGALLQNHGAVSYGRSLEEAYERAQALEWMSRLHLQAFSVGQPRVLSEAELADVLKPIDERLS